MGVVLIFFFLQKDLGPALVLGATFLALYAVTRHRAMLVAGGLAMLVAGVWIGYRMATPFMVYQRLRIWLDPWDNGLRNGDQIAHGFWALATGGMTGTGLGLGDTGFIPAGHTDLVLTAIGEELGFAGVASVIVLYVLLVARGLRAASRAPSHYTFFLSLGLTLITAFQIALISAGVLGLMPLSGVVSPFLSYGKSSMFANCIIFGILLAISSERPAEDRQKPFQVPMKRLAAALALIAAILVGKAAYIQTVKADDAAITPALTKQADGNYRYQYNPRLIDVAQGLPQGSIYDRNGIMLATAKWEELESQREQLESLGVDIEAACAREESRHYPFGGQLFHLLGNVRTRENWGAGNSDYIEREYIGRLRGFDDHAELVKRNVIEFDPKTRQAAPKEITTLRRDFRDLLPLLRYRHRPGRSDVQALLQRERNSWLLKKMIRNQLSKCGGACCGRRKYHPRASCRNFTKSMNSFSTCLSSIRTTDMYPGTAFPLRSGSDDDLHILIEPDKQIQQPVNREVHKFTVHQRRNIRLFQAQYLCRFFLFQGALLDDGVNLMCQLRSHLQLFRILQSQIGEYIT